jgi:ABC-type lipoprotein export system ATPase subunit
MYDHDGDIEFDAPPTVSDFMMSEAKMRVLMGPVGSGKSTASVMEILRRASEQEPGSDGIRRSRCCVVRQTVRQLQDTTIKTFCDWFKPGIAGVYLKT